MSTPQQADSRKQYRKPALKIYGDIQSLTEVVGSASKVDGGGSGMNRTS